MDFKVILTPQAQDDLREIVSFIARNNSSRARTFGNELIDQALSLASLPERGRVVPEIAESSVREMVHGSYRIIYEIHDKKLLVLVVTVGHRKEIYRQ